MPVNDHLTGTPPDSAAALSVRGLTKRYGAFTAVDAIDLDVARGEVFGFLGPNGSGKTTTIRMLTGTIRPQAGQALVLGEDVLAHPDRVKRRIGYMSQRFALFEDMTVAENLRFYAGVYNLTAEQFEAAREYVLTMADLHGREDELTANLSVGWRQRLALGAATIHQPELLFLDEPTSGVDPVARGHFWDLLYDLGNRGVTLFVTTHYMDEASHCTQLAFIHDGHLIAAGSPTQLRRTRLTERIHDIATGTADHVQRWLEKADGVHEAYRSGTSVHAAVSAEVPAETLRTRLLDAGFSDVVVTEIAPTLEDVFVNLVAQQNPPGRADDVAAFRRWPRADSARDTSTALTRQAPRRSVRP